MEDGWVVGDHGGEPRFGRQPRGAKHIETVNAIDGARGGDEVSGKSGVVVNPVFEFREPLGHHEMGQRERRQEAEKQGSREERGVPHRK